jgi:hypothetical protein
MTRFIHRSLLAACVLAGAMLVTSPSQAQQPGWQGHTPNLNNYYMTPGYGGATASQLYVSPGPVPPFVGHTYITYQPLAPHNQLYPHYNSYHRYYDEGRGLTRAKVTYKTPKLKTMASYAFGPFRIAR